MTETTLSFAKTESLNEPACTVEFNALLESICVEDDGPGLPPRDYEHIFQPFVRHHDGDVEFSRSETGFRTHLRLPEAATESGSKS